MKKRHGFTLIELLITLAMLAIIATVAVPGMMNFVRGQRVATQANDLLIALTFARSEAVKRGIPVSVCASADGASCTGNTDWETGWIVFIDTDGPGPDGLVNPDGNGTDDRVLRVREAVGQAVIAAGRSFVTFDGQGLAVNQTNFTLDPTGCTGNQRRTISMMTGGRAEVEEGACP